MFAPPEQVLPPAGWPWYPRAELLDGPAAVRVEHPEADPRLRLVEVLLRLEVGGRGEELRGHRGGGEGLLRAPEKNICEKTVWENGENERMGLCIQNNNKSTNTYVQGLTVWAS